MAYIQKHNPFKSSPTRQPSAQFKGQSKRKPWEWRDPSEFGKTEEKVIQPVEGGEVKASIHPDWSKTLGDPKFFKPKKTKLQKFRELEEDINIKLGDPKGKAMEGSEIISEYKDEGDMDRLRHVLAAAYTSKKVGFVGANILGLAHEVLSPNTPSEHKSDIINNAIGSIVGMLPFANDEQLANTVKWLNDRGWLSEDPNKKMDLSDLDFDIDFDEIK